MRQYIGTFERTITYKVILVAKNEEDFIKKGIRSVKKGDAEVEEDIVEVIDAYEDYSGEYD